MSKEKENKLVPKLRFSEFSDDADWQNVVLDDYGNTISGLSGKSGSDFGEGKPYVTYMQVFNDAKTDLTKCSKVLIADGERQNSLQLGDILITTSSETPNEVGFASVIIEEPKELTYLNSFCFGFRPNNLKLFNPAFCSYLFRSQIYRKSIAILAQGSTRFNISKGSFLNLKIPTTLNFLEQQKIADCLSSLDDLIKAENEKLDALKDHKKGLMQQLFPEEGDKVPKLRFPEFKDSEEWEEKPLGSIAENLDYKRVPITGSERKKGTTPYYGASGIIDYVDGFIFNEALLCISEDGANLIARTYPVAFSITGKTWVNNHAHVLKFENFHTQHLVENYINFKNIEDFLTGLAQPKLNRGKLDLIKIPLPSNPNEIKKVSKCLSSLDGQIAIQTQKVENLKLHKKGLMQGLFPNIN